MKTTKFFVCLCLALVPAAAFAAFTIDVSPGTITWDTNTWVDVRITNNTESAGYVAYLTVFVDPEKDGVIGSRDVPLANFRLRDGRTNRLGAVSIPHDTDKVTNGAIIARIPCFGIDNPLHMIGSYIFRVALTNGTSPAVDTFSVTQPTTTVYITGTVVNYTNPATRIAGAFLDIYPFTRALGFFPSMWTDTNGAFRLYIPLKMTGNVDGIMTRAFGYFSAPYREDTGEWISAYKFTNDLKIGNNALTNTLKLIPSVPGLLHTVSGNVIDNSGNPIPYAVVMFEEESEDGGGDAGAMAVTDTNGNFRLPFPDGMTVRGTVDGGFMNLGGYVAGGAGPYTMTQDISGVVITCPLATILARNRATEAETGTGVAGVNLSFESDSYWSSGYSITGGTYEIGLVSNIYKAGADEDFIQCLGYINITGYDGIGITNSGIYTNAPFYLTRGYAFSGNVYDHNTNALTGGSVDIARFGGWGAGNKYDVNRQGFYLALAATGTYRATAQDFSGYLSQRYTNHFSWEGDEGGPVADPIIVTTNGATNINFFLPRASYIRGTVLGTNSPLTNANVSAEVKEGDDSSWRGGTQTDSSGNYEIEVLAGTNYTVRAQGPDSGFFMVQYWSNKVNDYEADLVTTDTNAPATNINFNLELGGQIEGQVFEPDGVTPLTNTWGHVEAQTTNEESSGVGGMDIDQYDGTYSFAVAPGVYHVRAEVDGWPNQYYDGYYESQRDQANLVTVEVGQVTGGINFTMMQPSYIEGMIMGDGSPVSGMQVQVSYVQDTNNWWTSWVGQERSDASGHYSVPVPPGTNYIVATQPDNGSFYPQKYWSNVTAMMSATLLNVADDSTVSNIDFNLELGMRIEGQVLDENNNPMTNIWVNALLENTNGWYDNAAFGQTDSGGYYGFLLPATTSYIVCVQRPWDRSFEDWWYPATYYNDRFSVSYADRVATNAGSTVGGVDFHMMLGYLVEGFVMQSDGSSPAENGWMQSWDGLNQYVNGDGTDGSGWYEVVLPTNLPLYLIGSGSHLLQSEYYQDVTNVTDATAVQAPAMTTVRVDFALYNWTEDHDSDGISDFQEDSRPDGIYKSGEDWGSFTNYDTEGDKVDDGAEWNCCTSPKLEDTDGDTYSDYQEIYVTGTDPTATPEGSNSYLHCLASTRNGSNIVLRWSSIDSVNNYYVQRSTNLISGLFWDDIAGPITATGDVMTVTDSDAPPRSSYRIRIPYAPPP